MVLSSRSLRDGGPRQWVVATVHTDRRDLHAHVSGCNARPQRPLALLAGPATADTDVTFTVTADQGRVWVSDGPTVVSGTVVPATSYLTQEPGLARSTTAQDLVPRPACWARTRSPTHRASR